MTAMDAVVTLAAAIAIGLLFVRGPSDPKKKD